MLARRMIPLVVVLFLVGCSSADDPGSPLSSSPAAGTTAQAPSPSPVPSTNTPLPPSPTPEPSFQPFPPAPPGESAEHAAIRAGVEKYHVTLDRYLRNPSLADLGPLAHVTLPGSEEDGVARQKVKRYRDRGRKVVGEQAIRDLKIEHPRGQKTALVTYCLDVSKSPIVIVATNETIAPKIPTLRETMTLALNHDNGWRVSRIRNEVARC